MKKIIVTENAPAAIGPYSQAVVANGLMYVSGQIPVNPQTGKVESDDISEQTAQCLANLSAIIDAAGAAKADVIKVNVYTTDMTKFANINEVYKTVFLKDFPARAVVEVGALPMGVKVEIEAVVAVDD